MHDLKKQRKQTLCFNWVMQSDSFLLVFPYLKFFSSSTFSAHLSKRTTKVRNFRKFFFSKSLLINSSTEKLCLLIVSIGKPWYLQCCYIILHCKSRPNLYFFAIFGVCPYFMCVCRIWLLSQDDDLFLAKLESQMSSIFHAFLTEEV